MRRGADRGDRAPHVATCKRLAGGTGARDRARTRQGRSFGPYFAIVAVFT